MPRRTPDKGVKPFEFRTGVGGLPALGGMYRCGDPATIPPNKIHLGVNVRITPGGMISRPGLAEEYDTTVDECITGITDDGDTTPQTLLLYPLGLSSRWPAHFLSDNEVQPWSLQAISLKWDEGPPTGDDPTGYSEAIYILHGAPDTADGADQPVLVRDQTDDPLGTWGETYPFVLNGRIVQFVHTDRLSPNGVPVRALALFELILPEAAPGHRPSGCYLTSRYSPGQWEDYLGQRYSCPARIPGDVWPWGDPTGQARLLSWVPNLLIWTTSPDDWVVSGIVSIPERLNDPITGEVGVREVLYAILQDGTPGAYNQTLLRYDGVSWSVELALPVYSGAAGPMKLGSQANGPWVVTSFIVWNAGGALTTTPWGRQRLEDGTYGALTWTWEAPFTGPSPIGGAVRPTQGAIQFCTNYQGWPMAIMSLSLNTGNDWLALVGVAKGGVFASDADWHTLKTDTEPPPPVYVPTAYAWRGAKLVTILGTSEVCVYDYSIVPPPLLGTVYLPGGNVTWLQTVGARLYAGGSLKVWDFSNPASPVVIWTRDSNGQSVLNEPGGAPRGCLPIGWLPKVDGGEGVGIV